MGPTPDEYAAGQFPPTPQGLDAVGILSPGVQVNHRKPKFICFGCGHEYRDLRGLWDCVEEHLGVEI